MKSNRNNKNKKGKEYSNRDYVKVETIFHHINNTLCPITLSISLLEKEIEKQLKEEISTNSNIVTRDLMKYQQRKEEIKFFDEIFQNITTYTKHLNSLDLSEVHIKNYVPVKDLKFNLINKFNYLLREYKDIKKDFGEYPSTGSNKFKEYIEDGLKKFFIYAHDPKHYENKSQIKLEELNEKQKKYLEIIEKIIK